MNNCYYFDMAATSSLGSAGFGGHWHAGSFSNALVLSAITLTLK
jgi:hypothetical protein